MPSMPSMPIKHGDFPYSYVKVYQRVYHTVIFPKDPCMEYLPTLGLF